MKPFFEKVRKVLKENYWLQPVLLVALVFVLVFALQGIPTLINNIKENKSNSAGCAKCTTSSLSTVSEKIEADDSFYILITQKTCSNCTAAYPIINKFLSTYSSYAMSKIDIEKNANSEYDDSTITDQKLYDFGKIIDIGITSSGYDSIYDTTTDAYVFLTPSIIHIEKGVATEALEGVASYSALVEFMGADD